MWLNTIGGTIFYSLGGVPFWIAFSVGVLDWSVSLILIYYGTGWIKSFLGKREMTKFLIQRWTQLRERIPKITTEKKRIRQRKKVNWLMKRGGWILIMMNFIPFLPALSIAIIIAVKMVKMKHGLFYLLLGNFFRCLIYCLTIYYLIPSP